MRRLCIFLLIGLSASSAWAGESYRYAPAKVTLIGTLKAAMFYGPPRYGEDPKHDRKEHVFVLELDTPIDLAADAANDFNVAQANVRRLQVVPLPDDPKALPRLRNRHVQASGTLFGAQTGHHHTDVLLHLETITPLPR